MNAFQKANMENGGVDGSDLELAEPMSLPENFKFDPVEFAKTGGDGKMFWRCYFNAVSCF